MGTTWRTLTQLVPYLIKDDVGRGDVLVGFGELLREELANTLVLLGEPPLQVVDSLVRRQGTRP